MRLSSRIKNTIKTSIEKTFGNNAEAFLFGSRVDDSIKGGDIDIAIKTDLPKKEFQKRKIALITTLFRYGYGLKIDFVQYSNKADPLLQREIQNSCIPI